MATRKKKATKEQTPKQRRRKPTASQKKFDAAVLAEVAKQQKKKPRKKAKRGAKRKPVSKAPLVGQGTEQFKDDNHPNWVHVDKDKTLVASVDFEQFPPELSLMVIPDEPHMVWLKIREEGRRVFGGNPLIIPCKVHGAGMSQVHYELVGERTRSGVTWRDYRKYSNQRKVMERAKDGRGRPMVLPG